MGKSTGEQLSVQVYALFKSEFGIAENATRVNKG